MLSLRDANRRHILRPDKPDKTRILYLAQYAPEEPEHAVKAFPGDGGYPAYYAEVRTTLAELGYNVVSSASTSAVLFARGNTDFVFSLYNRMPLNNSEILIAAFCEYIRVPYLGARPNIRALAEDKWLSKLTAKAIGIPAADGVPFSSVESLRQPPTFSGPYFVKDRFGAASEGITMECIQDTWNGARRVAESFLERGTAVLVERYAPGIDVTVPILGGDPPLLLGYVNPISDKRGNILTEDLKLNDPLGYQRFDVGLSTANFEADARALWSAAGPMDYLRMDYRFDPNTGSRTFLEFNLCCFIGSSGAICMSAAEWGLAQHDVLGHVVEYSLRRQRFGREQLEWVK
jgi:D-alanine-D-alanine ligase